MSIRRMRLLVLALVAAALSLGTTKANAGPFVPFDSCAMASPAKTMT
jgi:hypothetical protein